MVTNGGNNGDEFIKNARKIIGKNTMALITCFVAKNYLKIVEKLDNVLLNSPHCNCMKDFLNIVCHENLDEMEKLQKKVEQKYQELDNSFHFKEINDSAFNFPKFKETGKFEELDFKDSSDNSCIIL